MNIFNAELDENLILCVRNNPVLYDINDEFFKDSTIKYKVWKDIGRDLGGIGGK